MVLLIGASIISILWGNPPSFFRSWERLGLFIMITMVVSPLIQNQIFIKLRLVAFQWLIYFSVLIGVLSFFCYFAGINYMTSTIPIKGFAVGWFGGITIHSMLLGPISAIASTYLLWLYYHYTALSTKQKWIVIIAFFCSSCSVLLSASRGSFAAMLVGIVSTTYFSYRENLPRLIKILFSIIMVALLCYPIYKPFMHNLLEKQRANIEAGSTFSSRESKWENRIEEFKKSPIFGIGFASIDPQNTTDYRGGTIEPGTSWLAVLSMTGILGTITIIGLLFSCYTFLLHNLYDPQCILYLSLLNIFALHMCTEGYIFAGGNFLFFVFWLLIGVIYAYKHNRSTTYQ